ncbi:putative N-acetylated-alpha-linked acidic dipeptidase isoform X2 [Eriocheir sinensis]|nr:putative N-acetylated-alpha-linked acidic dipeptidase isoform X2 [Eriocheir sinensis]
MIGRGKALGWWAAAASLLLALASLIFPAIHIPPTAAADTTTTTTATLPKCNKSSDSHMIRRMREAIEKIIPEADDGDLFGTAGEKLLREMKASNIRRNLKYLTTQGHMAGTKHDLDQAEHLRKKWLEQGLDQVFLQPYNVQLSKPSLDKPNKVYLLDEAGQVKFTSSVMEEVLKDKPYDSTIPPAFLAFSPSGTVTSSEVVFANYGAYEDFEALQRAGVQVAGRLVIAKFGNIFRGDKVLNAERFNASGMILYTDPADYHPDWHKGGEAYPNTFWLPESGIQRGSLLWRDGDPTTPYYPSIDGSHHIDEGHEVLPRIPAHTISYNDARKILIHLGGAEVPEAWRGGLGITYRLGPNMTRPGWKVRLEVNNEKQVSPIFNVMGVVRGREEPDRYVIFGNHRDSWTYGSCDPSSGTAVMMEVVRAYGKLLAGGWRPRRSVIFGSWGAGEFGFFGATEMVEEYLKSLEHRAVAYLNVDIAVIQTYNLVVSATPLLHKAITEAAKRAPAPDPSLGYKTLWDHWTQRGRPAAPDAIDYNLGSTSEHAPFYQRVGVPTSYMLWEINLEEYNWSDYPLYHSTFDDFESMVALDPDFLYHLSLGHLWGLTGVALADAQVLPMDPNDEAVMLRRMAEGLRKDFGADLGKQHLTLAYLESLIDRFEQAAETFNTFVNNATEITPLLARQLNDQLMAVERSYIFTEGSFQRPYMKNMMFGTSLYNQYEGWLAPGVRDALLEARHCSGPCQQEWELVRQQLSILQHVVNSAVINLKNFMYL